ncbi:MAG: hemolysin family protein [Candidatus Kariarchaeaceae archaeon]
MVENPVLYITIILLLVFLNGFFVAAEFAFVRVRASRIRELIALGSSRARRVQQVTRELQRTTSSAQLGITLSSIALGFIGEEFFSEVIIVLIHKLGYESPDNENIITITAFVTGYMIVTYLHVVFGELIPKVISIESTDKTALWCAEPMYWFMFVTEPLLRFFVYSSNMFLKLIRIKVTDEIHGQGYTEEELKIIIRDSIKRGEVEEYESQLIFNILEFTDKAAKDLLTPRIDIKALPITSSVIDVFNLCIETGFSRIPVFEKELDTILGFIHIKDTIPHIKFDEKPKKEFDISKILRNVIIVHEAKPIDDLLKAMQEQQTQVSIIVDEYGSVEGLVTLEDIMETIIGPIADEFDPSDEPIHEAIEVVGDLIRAGGQVSIEQFNQTVKEKFDLSIESEVSVTLAGYILELFESKIPSKGEEVHDNSFHYKISQVDGNRIVTIEVSKIDN